MATPKLQGQAGKLNLVIEQGSTFNPVLTYQDDTGALIDLTGYTSRMMFRQKKTDTVPLLSLTDGAGLTLGDAAGTIAILITDIETAALTDISMVYDLELISGTGIVTRLIEGSASLSTETTR